MYREIYWIHSGWKEGRNNLSGRPAHTSFKVPWKSCVLGTVGHFVSDGFSWNRNLRSTFQQKPPPLWARNYHGLRTGPAIFFPQSPWICFPLIVDPWKISLLVTAERTRFWGKKETKTSGDLIKSVKWILVISLLLSQSQSYPWIQATGQNKSSYVSEVCQTVGYFAMFSFSLRSVRKTKSIPRLPGSNPSMELHSPRELCAARIFAKPVSAVFWIRASLYENHTERFASLQSRQRTVI